ncbi:hypothetical protein O181_062767 [Austropuccinia psidii MF-1]|uniref:Uncharacterized protein n=1 Tax=Austropuccinia psidii MF-1 TaxID=1389203 RepID=A0A9Q3ESR4_9BASI|nr:hypothetical protein [Austropuccinia psidii MF-1]
MRTSRPSGLTGILALNGEMSLSIGTIVFYALLCILLSYSILDLISPHSRVNAGKYDELQNIPLETTTNSTIPSRPSFSLGSDEITGNPEVTIAASDSARRA